jgi:hypothetical protein
MTDYPKEYQPALAKERKPEKPAAKYAIGFDSRSGYDYGPFDNVKDALEIMPSKNNSCIYLIDSAGDDRRKLYTWNDVRGVWILNG